MTTPVCPHCGTCKCHIVLYWNKQYYKFRKYQQDGEPLDFNRAGIQLAQIRSQIKDKTFSPVDWIDSKIEELKFKHQVNDWLNEKAKEWKAGELAYSTWKRYDIYNRKYFAPFLGNSDVREIAKDASELISKFNDKLRKSNLALKTRRDTMNTLRSIMRWMHSNKITKEMPKFPDIKGDDSTVIVAPEYGEQTEILLRLPEVYREPIEFMMETGLRIGELCALYVSDIALSKNEATIQRTYSEHMLHETTKGKNKKPIPLSDRAFEIAKNHINGRVGRVFLFINPRTGKGYKPRTLQNAWKKYAGLDNSIPLRSGARHAFCTQIVESGASPIEAMALMRHADIRSTMRYYHANTQKLRDLVNKRSKNVVDIKKANSGMSSE